jgi:hypothetical protein
METTEEYQKIYDKAKSLAKDDVKTYPLIKKETERDRFERHLIGMIEIY